jgi:hypothetical protein
MRKSSCWNDCMIAAGLLPDAGRLYFSLPNHYHGAAVEATTQLNYMTEGWRTRAREDPLRYYVVVVDDGAMALAGELRVLTNWPAPTTTCSRIGPHVTNAFWGRVPARSCIPEPAVEAPSAMGPSDGPLALGGELRVRRPSVAPLALACEMATMPGCKVLRDRGRALAKAVGPLSCACDSFRSALPKPSAMGPPDGAMALGGEPRVRRKADSFCSARCPPRRGMLVSLC